MAGALIGALRVTLGLDSAEFTAGTKKAQGQMTAFQRKMAGIGDTLKGAFAGLIGADLLGMMRDMAQRGLDNASALGEQAEQLGVTTRALQEYRYAATQAGLSQDEMDAALAKGTQLLGDAANGTGAAAKAYEKLDIKIRDAKGNVRDIGDLIPEVAEALKSVDSPAERAAILVDLFGKSGAKLAPLLSQGAAGVNDLRKAANELGIVISDDLIRRADEAADKMAALGQVKAAKESIWAAENAAAILQFDENLNKLKASFFSFSNELQRAVDAIDSWNKQQAEANAEKWRQLGEDYARIGNNIATTFNKVGAYFANLKSRSVEYVAAMVRSIREWISGALGRIWQGALDKIETVKRGFFNLYDAVVGNSYVPDMVDGIAAEMKRLDGVMVQPVAKATQSTKEKFRDMQQFVADLLAQLFPQAAEQNAIEAQILKLNAAFKAGAVKAETYSAAIEELNRQLRELRNGKEVNPEDDLANLPDGSDEVMVNGRKLLETLPKLSVATKTTFEGMARHVQNTAATIANAIADMQGALSGFISSIKKGDILGIIGGLANVIGSVLDAVGSGGSISSLFGGKKMPAYAGGTNFHPGGLALVGEKGAEIVDLPRGSKVFPHGTGPSAGAVVVQVQANDYFDAKVQRVSGNVVAQSAPSIVRASSQTAQGQLIRRSRRRLA